MAFGEEPTGLYIRADHADAYHRNLCALLAAAREGRPPPAVVLELAQALARDLGAPRAGAAVQRLRPFGECVVAARVAPKQHARGAALGGRRSGLSMLAAVATLQGLTAEVTTVGAATAPAKRRPPTKGRRSAP